MDVRPGDFLNGKLDQPVVNQDGAAGPHITIEGFVGNGDPLRGAFRLLAGQDEGGTGLEKDFSVFHQAGADLRPLGIEHSGGGIFKLPPDRVEQFKSFSVAFMISMGKIEARDIHSGFSRRIISGELTAGPRVQTILVFRFIEVTLLFLRVLRMSRYFSFRPYCSGKEFSCQLKT